MRNWDLAAQLDLVGGELHYPKISYADSHDFLSVPDEIPVDNWAGNSRVLMISCLEICLMQCYSSEK
jgi:hypothetical protein